MQAQESDLCYGHREARAIKQTQTAKSGKIVDLLFHLPLFDNFYNDKFHF